MQYKCPGCGNLIEEGTSPCPFCKQQIKWPESPVPANANLPLNQNYQVEASGESVIKKILTFPVKYMKWLSGIYNDTAGKLVKVIKIFSMILSWICIIAGFGLLFVLIIMGIAEGEIGIILAGLAAPLLGLLAAMIFQVLTAISVMTLNMISDIANIRSNMDANK